MERAIADSQKRHGPLACRLNEGVIKPRRIRWEELMAYKKRRKIHTGFCRRNCKKQNT
jgi:hypothetical protein